MPPRPQAPVIAAKRTSGCHKMANLAGHCRAGFGQGEAAVAALRFTGEPSLDELLEDEMMAGVMRCAGIDAAELRRRLAELAHRLGRCAGQGGSHGGRRRAAFC
jgi:hypothetical protein